MNKIIINESSETELITIFSHLCIQIQKDFDISPILLTHLINEVNFVDNCKFLYHQSHYEMLNNLGQFKDNYNELIDGEGTLNIDDNEYEKCGHLKKNHANGYVEYCNIHKYLHPHPEMPIKNEFGPIVDHEFIIKDNYQILREKYNQSIGLIYQIYINQLYSLIKQLFNYELMRSCEISTIAVKDDNLDDLFHNMKNNNNIFKSKVLYEYIDLKKSSNYIINQSIEGFNQSKENQNQLNENQNQSKENSNHSNQNLNQSNENLNQSKENLNQSKKNLNQSNEDLNQSKNNLNQSNEDLNQSKKQSNQLNGDLDHNNTKNTSFYYLKIYNYKPILKSIK